MRVGTYYTKEYITRKIHKRLNMTSHLYDLTRTCRITYMEITLTNILLGKWPTPSFPYLSQRCIKIKIELNTVSFTEFIRPKSFYWWLHGKSNETRQFWDNYRRSRPIWDDLDYYKMISTTTRQYRILQDNLDYYKTILTISR